ncbi:hypothetical protein EV426DRAFT_702956 [Tirmania nivea]|nr:hypothetical protein EV426DRAFT_702956 [Tirmania nivea]
MLIPVFLLAFFFFSSSPSCGLAPALVPSCSTPFTQRRNLIEEEEEKEGRRRGRGKRGKEEEKEEAADSASLVWRAACRDAKEDSGTKGGGGAKKTH